MDDKVAKDHGIVLPMIEFFRQTRELEDGMKKATHHNFVAVLKEIACTPVPCVPFQILKIFNDLYEGTYNRKECMKRLRESAVANDYCKEDLDEIIQQLEVSHGYSENGIKNLIDFIRKHHSYNKSQITMMLETLNVPDQYTILHYGALFNNVAFCRCLVNEFDCNINLINCDGQTPLHIAARLTDNKRPEHPSSILEYLVTHSKIKMNVQDNNGRTPLHFAVMYNCVGNAKCLIGYGADVDIVDISGATPLHYACRDVKSQKMICLFFNFPHLFSRETQDKKKPIDIMIECNDSETVKHLFNQEHEVVSLLKEQYEDAIYNDSSRLFFACRQTHRSRTIAHLINPHSLMYVDEWSGLSSLMVAVQYRQLECIKQLLRNKYFTQEVFDLATSVSFCTVLHICAKAQDNQITQLLLNSHFMSNTLARTSDISGDTALHVCARVGNIFMTQLLLRYTVGHGSSLLTKKNKEKLIPFHVAVQAGHLDVINEMYLYADSSMVNMCDDQQRTGLHMAAAKGHIQVVDTLLRHQADAHLCDINEWTPLHHAVRCNAERTACITSLVIDSMININALTIRQETPLHIACEHASSKIVKQLIDFDCDLFATNIDGHNCFEVAIEAKNEEVVRYLIEHDHCFNLMRNSQIRTKNHSSCSLFTHQCEVDTPMRKLIRNMPSMALLVLDKCSMTIRTKDTAEHKSIFMYEFLEDQFIVNTWNQHQKSSGSDNNVHGTLYTSNTVDVVMKHPLFLMARYQAYDLMSHPLSSYLLNMKFQKFGIFLYILLLLLYIIYLGLFTTLVLRTHHPATFYNLTDVDFQNDLCYNVSQALRGSSGSKTAVDYILKYVMYLVTSSLLLKNVFSIVEILQTRFFGTFRYWFETVAVLASFVFVYDQNFQMHFTLRCPFQWELGAFGLLLSWLNLLGYIQFIPVVGTYVTMLFVIIKKFLRFSSVLLILISGFAFAFHMVFQNFEPFQNTGYSYIKTAFMISGELDFDDRIHNTETKAYYKITFVIYLLFLVIMTVLVTNLLIGLAVGEIPPLMKQATDDRNRLFYELVAICEVLRCRLMWILRRTDVNDTIAYSYRDLYKKTCFERCSRSPHDRSSTTITDNLLE
ncbi:unnamed protein product [Adineta ricciae]|uniref:Ion transport domain-containing protein n=1 Tax=Adineta ricciae TaxID=249248 RepID=A0A815NWH3_ADIRI|nr:unnamed protein product [Adineta ricciae]